LAAERRAKAAEASRASVAPPPSAGVSSRDYLELREQLNRKDKELLSLRDEVTSRDRRLLDASDRALELERAQAQHEESIEGLQRQLDEVTTKVAGYEVDLEAAKKRRDELNTRLTRADESVRNLERELDQGARRRTAASCPSFKSLHEEQVRGLEEQAAADSARLRADHARRAEKASASHADAIGGSRRARAPSSRHGRAAPDDFGRARRGPRRRGGAPDE
jgi:chromosome segregation ATPase